MASSSSPVGGNSPLGKRISSGARWIGIAMGARHFARLLSLFLVQLIVVNPSRLFGDWGVAMVLVMALTTLRQLGFGQALINRDDSGTEDLETAASTTFWILLGSTIVILMLGVLGAEWMVAGLGGEVRLTHVLRVLFLSAILDPFGSIPASLLQKRLRFEAIARCEASASYMFLIASVVGALAGLDIWALVVAHVVSRFVQVAALIWMAGWRPRLRFDSRIARELFSFGGWLWLNAVLQIIHRLSDNLVLYKVVGSQITGQYVYAKSFTQSPSVPFSNGLHRVLFPILSAIKTDHARLRSVYEQGTGLLAFVVLPATAGFWFVAGDLNQILGPRMGDLTSLMRVLALLSAATIAGAITRPLLFALGDTRQWAAIGAARQVLIVSGIVALGLGLTPAFLRDGPGWSALGMAWAYTLPTLLSLLSVHILVVRRLKVELRSLLYEVAVSGVCTAAMIAMLNYSEPLLGSSREGLTGLSARVLTGSVAYLGASLVLNRGAIANAVQAVSNLTRR